MREGLSEVGVAPADVDLVLISHGDTDHFIGLHDRRDTLAYVNARYVLHRKLRTARTGADGQADPATFYEEDQRVAQTLAEQIGEHILLVNDDEEIEPGLRGVNAAGHRSAHLAFELESEGRHLLSAEDTFIAPIFVNEQTRGCAANSDPDLGIPTRKALLRRAARVDTVLYAPLFPFPGFVGMTPHENHVAGESAV